MKIIPVLLIAITTFVSGCTSVTNHSNQTIGINAGDKAPDFSLVLINGSVFKLSEADRPVILYFMATWCPYCNEEYKTIGKLYTQYPNVELLSVSIDPSDSREMLQKYKLGGRPGLFAEYDGTILSSYNAITTTTKYVINKDGIIVYRGVGPLAEENWRTIFNAVT